MARHRQQQYTTRDPEPVMRDPVMVPRHEEELKSNDPEYVDHVPVIRQDPIRCAACGELAIWRPGGTTVPNVSTCEMFRWRSCAHCKQTHYIARAMTDQEKRKYLAPVAV